MKYSVIIPVYNAEKTLRRCVDSLLDQGFPDAEIILVNDGSKDGSAAICEEYAKNYDCVRFISQPNGGVSSARNAGLDAAQGEYILFVDSDDYVTPEFFTSIDQAVEAERSDLIRFSVCFEKGREKRIFNNKPVKASSRGELFPHIIDAICNKGINGPVAKLYRREIIESHCIRFPVGASVAEDRAFNIVYSFFIQSYEAVDNVVYVVNTENENSMSRKRHEDLQEQFEIATAYIDKELSAVQLSNFEKDGYRRALNFGVCRAIYHDAKLMIQDRVSWFSRQKKLMQICKRINGKHMKYPNTRYCKLITFPVRFFLAPVIDAVARKQMRSS